MTILFILDAENQRKVGRVGNASVSNQALLQTKGRAQLELNGSDDGFGNWFCSISI